MALCSVVDAIPLLMSSKTTANKMRTKNRYKIFLATLKLGIHILFKYSSHVYMLLSFPKKVVRKTIKTTLKYIKLLTNSAMTTPSVP